jgi:hypothetical protein
MLNEQNIVAKLAAYQLINDALIQQSCIRRMPYRRLLAVQFVHHSDRLRISNRGMGERVSVIGGDHVPHVKHEGALRPYG